ncbi:MAG: SemiSWEET transporter [Nitrospira sp.]|nr:SemiSWEET transporter [bacterium]MBL7048584.1 SemiSWEET transporter [Nitrospira sp.]
MINIDYISFIGLVAGTCTTLSFIPQVSKTMKTKETSSISLGMYLILATGIFLWTVYGFLIGSMPIMIANGISLLMAIFVLILKLRYG